MRAHDEFRRLVEELPVAVYTCDREGLITYFNQQAALLWGRSPALNDPADRFCGSFKIFSANGQPVRHAECWMALALERGREYVGKEILVERPDGTRLTALAHARPTYDEAGNIAGAINVVVDISDRKDSEEAQALLAAIVECSDDAIVSKSIDGRILSWNASAERLFGYTAAEAIGQRITLIVPPERYDEERAILALLRSGKRADHYDTVRVAKDGRRIETSLTVSPIFDGHGRVIAASSVARDITGRRQFEERLRQADRSKNEFLAMLAHELRNPLAPIRNVVEILRRHAAAAPELELSVEVIDRQVLQMTRLIDDLLDVARITANKLELRRQRIELGEVLRMAVETSRPLMEDQRQEFVLSLPAESIQLDGDLARLAQMTSNLLNNASRYTPAGGRVSLTVEREGSEAVITVRDNGIGISADALPHIFEMFTQAGEQSDQVQGGLGIGLTLVKRVVDLHDGRIDAHSDGAGKGSEFVIRLPALPAVPARPRAPEIPEPAIAATKSPLRVLVVDDNRDSAISLSMVMSLAGHEVQSAYDGLEAIETARTFRPEVILLDIGLPRMNGYDAARSIRQEPWGQGMVLIATTGWGQDADRQRSRDAGFDHHLIKPLDPAALLGLLASIKQVSAESIA